MKTIVWAGLIALLIYGAIVFWWNPYGLMTIKYGDSSYAHSLIGSGVYYFYKTCGNGFPFCLPEEYKRLPEAKKKNFTVISPWVARSGTHIYVADRILAEVKNPAVFRAVEPKNNDRITYYLDDGLVWYINSSAYYFSTPIKKDESNWRILDFPKFDPRYDENNFLASDQRIFINGKELLYADPETFTMPTEGNPSGVIAFDKNYVYTLDLQRRFFDNHQCPNASSPDACELDARLVGISPRGLKILKSIYSNSAEGVVIETVDGTFELGPDRTYKKIIGTTGTTTEKASTVSNPQTPQSTVAKPGAVSTSSSASKIACATDSLYSYSYYVSPNMNIVCYKKQQMPNADPTSFLPLEDIPTDITQKLNADSGITSGKDFALDKNNFYINGEVAYSTSGGTFKLVDTPNLSHRGSIVVNGTTYQISLTGLVGATLK